MRCHRALNGKALSLDLDECLFDPLLPKLHDLAAACVLAFVLAGAQLELHV